VEYSTLTRILPLILHEWRQALLLEMFCKVSAQIFLCTVPRKCTICSVDHTVRDVAGDKRQLKFRAYVALVIYRSHYKGISLLRVNDLTVILLTWRKWWANNASKQQMEFNSGFKGLMGRVSRLITQHLCFRKRSPLTFFEY